MDSLHCIVYTPSTSFMKSAFYEILLAISLLGLRHMLMEQSFNMGGAILFLIFLSYIFFSFFSENMKLPIYFFSLDVKVYIYVYVHTFSLTLLTKKKIPRSEIS